MQWLPQLEKDVLAVEIEKLSLSPHLATHLES